MSVISNPPYPSYFDVDGSPLENGYLYFGAANQNPETNPITVYWDSAYTQPALQPIRTSGGFTVRSGTPANIYVSTDFSITVRDKNRRLVYSKLLSDGQSVAEVNLQYSTQAITATAGQTVFGLSTSYTPGNNSLAVYRNGLRLVAGVNYTETTSTSITLSIGATAGDVLQFVTATPINPSSLGAAAVAYVQAGAGAVATDVQTVLRETVSVTRFGAVGDGVTDDTAAIRNAVNAAQGKTLLGSNGATYLIKDEIVIPSNVTIDWQGATIIDDVRTFRPPNQASRAKPLFYMYGVNNIKIKNLVYQSAPTRATVSDSVPTGIIWIGDNSTTGSGPTHDIEISNIQASNCADYTLFVAIVGNAYDLVVRNIDIQGGCSYGINIEYGLAATGQNPPDNYGMYPYNITVDNFNGYDNTTSVGFLRVAAAYNIKFLNCYGENVKSFIYAWTGDRSIQRVSENVVFENCTHYAGANFLTGVVNYVVQVLSPDKDGSTGVSLPVWTNQDHLFTFNNCQFKNNKQTDSAVFRFYGSQGSTVFNSCIFQDSYFGVRAGPATNPSYTSLYSLRFNDCVFKNNSRDVRLNTIRGVVFDHCKFLNQDGTLIPVKLEANSIYNEFKNCLFYGLATDIAYIVIDSGCVLNTVENCLFEDTGNTPPLDLSAKTLGANNFSSDQGLVRAGYAYYGLAGHPETLRENLANVSTSQLDADKRTMYTVGASLTKSITGVVNGVPNTAIRVISGSVGANITFVNNDPGETTATRIITSTGSNVTLTGTGWTATLVSVGSGWYLNT